MTIDGLILLDEDNICLVLPVSAYISQTLFKKLLLRKCSFCISCV